MSYSISELEGRHSGTDWPLIVQSVPCPRCRADVGQQCINVGTSNPMFAHLGKVRIDWHQERKELACRAFNAGCDEGIPVDNITPLLTGKGAAPSRSEGGAAPDPDNTPPSPTKRLRKHARSKS